MDKQVLKVEERDASKDKPKAIRASGKIPCVVYGKKSKNMNLSVDAIEFEKVYREAGSSAIIMLSIDDNKKNVLVHEVDFNPVTDEPEHIDFYEISMTEKITTNVPVKFVGEAEAVTGLGGTLMTNTTEIEVECLPADLPHEIEVDITVLSDFEATIHVSDIKLPNGVEFETDIESVVASVEPPRSEEELAELEEPVEEGDLPESEQGGDDEEDAESSDGEGSEKSEPSEESKEEDKKE